MEIRLDELNTFFGKLKEETPMPQSLMELIRRGDKMTFGSLETDLADFETLRKYLNKETIRKINRSTRKEPFPLVRIGNSPVYFAYNPKTGDCLGGYSVDDKREEEKFFKSI